VKLPDDGGVIYKTYGDLNFKHFETKTRAFTETSFTAVNLNGIEVGTNNLANLIVFQAADNPETYASGVVPPLWGLMNDEYLLGGEFDLSVPEFKVTKSFLLPPNIYAKSLLQEHVDIGANIFVMMSKADCAADQPGKTEIVNPSIWFFDLTTVQDIDVDGDGIIDGTIVIDPVDGVTVTYAGDPVDYKKGWTCREAIDSHNGAQAWEYDP